MAEFLRIIEVSKAFNSVKALNSVSLTVKEGEFFSLLGPSGCGKTTLLRIIAGLETPSTGKVELRGSDITYMPPHNRPVNTVFQSYALFPHLSVFENVAFGLRMKGKSNQDIKSKVSTALQLVQIEELSKRKPKEISGGQQQRVALARALVNEPDVLLLDEPLAALDPRLRRDVQIELKNLQRRLGTTFIFVTHDQAEALSLSDRLAIINRGSIEQLGTPQELYFNPNSEFSCSFLGQANVISGRVVNAGSTHVETALGNLIIDHADIKTGETLKVAIRPERVRLHLEPSSNSNVIEAEVDSISFGGSDICYTVLSGNQRLQVTVLSERLNNQTKIHDKCWIELPSASLTVLRK